MNIQSIRQFATFVIVVVLASCQPQEKKSAKAEKPSPTILDRTYDSSPDWSHDGQHIYFYTYRFGTGQLMRMRADGSQQERITQDDTKNYWMPRLASNTTRITFSSDKDRRANWTGSDIYVMNADGSGEVKVSNDSTVWSYVSELSPDGDYVLFTHNAFGAGEVYKAKADGSERVNLTNHESNDGSPAWSPDGKQIVFNSDRDGAPQLYIMNADGTDLRRITDPESGVHMNADWGPNDKIAFNAPGPLNTLEIYSINVDGSGKRRLTDNYSHDTSPKWSPDGSRIVFSTYRNGESEVYMMDANGENQLNLTETSVHVSSPFWMGPETLLVESRQYGSADIITIDLEGNESGFLVGDRQEAFFPSASEDGGLVYHSNNDGDNEIFYRASKEGPPSKLTDNTFNDANAQLSPDGKMIIFESDRGGNLDVYVMKTDGSSLRKLTNTEADDSNPAWSSNGRMITFHSNRDGDYEVFVMTSEGTEVRQVTNNDVDDYYPSFSKDGQWLAYSTTGENRNLDIAIIGSDGQNYRKLTNDQYYRNMFPKWSPYGEGRELVYASDKHAPMHVFLLDVDSGEERRITKIRY